MKNRICAITVKWILCAGFFQGIHAFAQVSTANVVGIVEDSTEARIPDASLKLINVLTGTENDSTTSHNGVFLLPGVLPGTYMLQIEREGFATAQVTGLTLNIGDTKSLLIRLRIGSVTETVQIDGAGITLNTADASVSTVVDRKFVANIPLNGRSFQDLISMTSGVLTESPQAMVGQLGASGGSSVNGQRTDANHIMVDGVSANFGTASLTGSHKIPSAGNFAGLTALRTTQGLASVDAVKEFRVLGSTYSAEYGDALGGQFTFLTHSGTNVLHGSFYDNRRYNAADSIDWFQGFLESQNIYSSGYGTFIPYHQNDYGGTLEVPVIIPGAYNGHDRTFLFLSFEELHVQQPTAFLMQYTPSLQMRKDAPSKLEAILSDFPFSRWEQRALLSQYVSYFSMPGNVRATGIRLDHAFSPKISTFLRYGGTPSNSQALNLSSLTATHGYIQTMTFGVNAQLSATRSNDFRLGFAKNTTQLNTYLSSGYIGYEYGYGMQAPTNLLTDLGVPASYATARGQAYIHLPGIGESTIDVDHASNALHQWNLRDTFSLQAGHHFLRFGIDQRRIVSAVSSAPLSVEADFFDQNSLLQNLASAISITRTQPATPTFNEFSAFLQDEWRISKSLTLSPGLRWEIAPPPHGKDGADAYTLIGSIASPATLQLAPRGTPLWHTSWFNLAPHLGLAWSADNRPGKEIVVRAGAGVYFETDNQPAAEAFSAIGFSATAHFENVPVPVTAAQLNFSTTPSAPYTNTTVFAFPHHLQLPYAFQWNVAVEKALGRNQAMTASWVGASGHRLLQQRRTDINSENPEFGEINYFPGGIPSNYESLQLKFQRSISPGIQALASYAWSHSLDYGSTDPAFPLTRGNSDLDVRHNLQAALSWDGRRLSGNWLHRNVIGGWGTDGRFTARTGFPVNLMGNLFSDPATGERYYSGVDLIPGRPLYLYGSQYPGGRMFNGGPNITNPAFGLPAGSAAGNAPRNQLRGFGDFQVNAAIRRDIYLYHRLNLQLRAESFNLFNHPTFGYVDPVLSNAEFGQATLLLNQSFGSTGPLYEPGGPRSLQFSVKLHF
jgi:hypothetical protein